jgi:hypothetical protein
MKPTPQGGFSANEMYDMLREGDFVVKQIPKGQKNNCYTIIDNSLYYERKKANKFNRFCDDLGAWVTSKGTSVKSYYVLSQDFGCVYKKNGEYCTVQPKKRNFILLVPQPDESDIVVMTRYHTALKRQTTFIKRVTWFNNTANEDISKLAFVEYVRD